MKHKVSNYIINSQSFGSQLICMQGSDYPKEVLEVIPGTDRAEKIDLDSGELPSMKTLGIIWKPKQYVFTY